MVFLHFFQYVLTTPTTWHTTAQQSEGDRRVNFHCGAQGFNYTTPINVNGNHMIPCLYSAIKIHPGVSIISQTRKGSLTQLNAEMFKRCAEQREAFDGKAGLGRCPGEYEKLKFCHNL